MEESNMKKITSEESIETNVYVSPPAFYRLPPDGHEFPPNFIEPNDGPMIPNKSDILDSKSFNQKILETPKTAPPPPPPRKIYRQDIIIKVEESTATQPTKAAFTPTRHSIVDDINSTPKQMNFSRSPSTPAPTYTKSANWRKDEKSEKSVRDKIAMFSKENIAEPVNIVPSKLGSSPRRYSSADLSLYTQSSAKSTTQSKSFLTDASNTENFILNRIKALSVENLDETDKGLHRNGKNDVTPIRFERALSVDDLNQNTPISSPKSSPNTLPRKTSNNLLARTTSFSGYSNANVEEIRRTSINTILEQRRKSMSKLRGLVIPEKVSEGDVSKVLGMPVIRSKDSERMTVSRVGGLPKIMETTSTSTVASRRNMFVGVPEMEVESKSSPVNQYIPSYRRTSYGMQNNNNIPISSNSNPDNHSVSKISNKLYPKNSTKDEDREILEKPLPNTIPPIKPPRTSLALIPSRITSEDAKSAVTDESDSDGPQSPVLSSMPIKHNLIRTLSSETNTSITSSNSTLTSGSGSQASCSSFGSTPTIDMSRKLNKTLSNELTVNRKIILASAKFRSGRDDMKTGDQKWYEDGDSTDGYEEEERRRFTSKQKQRIISNGNAAHTVHSTAPEKEMVHYTLATTNDSLVDKIIKVASYVEIVSDSEELPQDDKPIEMVVDCLPLPEKTPAVHNVSQTVESTTISDNGSRSIAPTDSYADDIIMTKVSSESKYGRAISEKKTNDLRTISSIRESRVAVENKRQSLSDIRKKFENKAAPITTPVPSQVKPPKETKVISHDRFSSWDSLASSSSSVSSIRNNSSTLNSQISTSSVHTPSTPSDYGSFSSLGSSHSLITPQDLQFIIEEADPPLETPDAFVVVLQRDTPESSVGITLAGGSDYETKEITIHKILTNSSAEKDGRLKRGDRILSINGLSMRGLTHRESLTVLKTPRLEVVMVATRAKSVIPQLLSKTKRASMGSLSSLPEKTVGNGEYNHNITSDDSSVASHSARNNEHSKNDTNSFNSDLGSYRNVKIFKDSAGLGFSIEGGYDSPKGDQPLLIKKVFMGGSAEKSGNIKAGDAILAINDTFVEKMTRIEVWNMMKKLPQGFVTITFK